MAEQLHNIPAAITTVFAAMLVAAHQNTSCAKVIPSNLINRFTLSSLRNNAQVKHNIVLGNGIYAKLDKISAFATQFTRAIAIQLNSPPGNDGVESVEDHPKGTKSYEHKVMF